ncbi:MAG: preprotein translocase subunit YajC [Bacillales bacterium]|jgi:preprotein translocase subunit YajC|nr:preprotein translocase subunit YajC [Bacillales bacterium]
MSQQDIFNFVPFIIMLLVFYFFLIRPQQKRQRETLLMHSSLQKGDKIVTIGGLHGTIDSVDEDTIIIKTPGGTHLTFDKSAVREVTVKKEV